MPCWFESDRGNSAVAVRQPTQSRTVALRGLGRELSVSGTKTKGCAAGAYVTCSLEEFIDRWSQHILGGASTLSELWVVCAAPARQHHGQPTTRFLLRRRFSAATKRERPEETRQLRTVCLLLSGSLRYQRKANVVRQITAHPMALSHTIRSGRWRRSELGTPFATGDIFVYKTILS